MRFSTFSHHGHGTRDGLAGIITIQVKQHGDEFFPAHPRNEVVGVPACHAQRVGHHAQAIVATQVAVGVVVLLEAINVEQRQRDGAIVTAGMVEQARGLRLKKAAVEQLRARRG